MTTSEFLDSRAITCPMCDGGGDSQEEGRQGVGVCGLCSGRGRRNIGELDNSWVLTAYDNFTDYRDGFLTQLRESGSFDHYQPAVEWDRDLAVIRAELSMRGMALDRG